MTSVSDSRRGQGSRPLLADPGPALVGRPAPPTTSSAKHAPGSTVGEFYIASTSAQDSGCVSRDSASGRTSSSSLHATPASRTTTHTSTHTATHTSTHVEDADLSSETTSPTRHTPPDAANTANIGHVASDDDDSGCAIEEYSWVPNGLNAHQVCTY